MITDPENERSAYQAYQISTLKSQGGVFELPPALIATGAAQFCQLIREVGSLKGESDLKHAISTFVALSFLLEQPYVRDRTTVNLAEECGMDAPRFHDKLALLSGILSIESPTARPAAARDAIAAGMRGYWKRKRLARAG